MRMPVDAVLARMLAGLHNAGFTDLVSAHLSVLRYPGPEGRRPSDVAAEARMTKQAMNYLIGQMERLGYLTRRDDPADQRSKRIHLTKRGHAAIRTIRATVGQVEDELERELGPEHFAQLRRLLIELNASSVIRERQPPPSVRGRPTLPSSRGALRSPRRAP